MVSCCVVETLIEFVTVSVYVLVEGGVTMTVPVGDTDKLPGVMIPVPPV